MKRILSLVMTLAIALSLSVTAFADNGPGDVSDSISDPTLREEWNKQQAEYEKIEGQIRALDAQFQKDNPGVQMYYLTRFDTVYDTAGLLWKSLGSDTLFTRYNGAGYYRINGTTNITVGVNTYKAYILAPDPKPSVTKAYLNKRAVLIEKMEGADDAGWDAYFKSSDIDHACYQQISDAVGENDNLYMAFQINNYMINYGYLSDMTAFTRNNYSYMIEKGNRDIRPYIKNGSTMVPLRSIINGLSGASITWDSSRNAAVANYQGTVIVMPIGSTTAYVNGNSVSMPVAAEVKGGTTMIPLRFVAETFGFDVNYDAATKVVTICGASKPVTGFDFRIPANFVPTDYGRYGCMWLTGERPTEFWEKDTNRVDGVYRRNCDIDLSKYTKCNDYKFTDSKFSLYIQQGHSEAGGDFIDAVITYPGTDFSLALSLGSLNSNIQTFLATVAATIEPVYEQ